MYMFQLLFFMFPLHVSISISIAFMFNFFENWMKTLQQGSVFFPGLYDLQTQPEASSGLRLVLHLQMAHISSSALGISPCAQHQLPRVAVALWRLLAFLWVPPFAFDSRSFPLPSSLKLRASTSEDRPSMTLPPFRTVRFPKRWLEPWLRINGARGMWARRLMCLRSRER